MNITVQDQYRLIEDTINASKQSFILTFLIEISTHRYNDRDIVAALRIHLDELKAEQYEAEAKADHLTSEQFSHD